MLSNLETSNLKYVTGVSPTDGNAIIWDGGVGRVFLYVVVEEINGK